MMSKNHEKVCTTLNCFEHLLILASTIPGCISFSAFTSLIGIPIVITSSVIRLKICAITAGIKKYTSIIKKKKKKKKKKSLTQTTQEELHTPIIRKFGKEKVHSTFMDKTWGADLADMQLISKSKKSVRFLLCVIDIFSKYA